MSKRTQLLHKLKHVYSHNTKLVLDVENKDIELIIEALEKQIAKKPRKIEVEGYRYTDTYRCPTCEGNFSGTGVAQYCYHCEQKLDWSVEDEQKAT